MILDTLLGTRNLIKKTLPFPMLWSSVERLSYRLKITGQYNMKETVDYFLKYSYHLLNTYLPGPAVSTFLELMPTILTIL